MRCRLSRFSFVALKVITAGAAVSGPLASGENLYKASTVISERENGNNGNACNALERALPMDPPIATSVQDGDTEGSEWWLEHEVLLRSAWEEWDKREQNNKLLPDLDESLIDYVLRSLMDQTRESPTLEHEAKVVGVWDEVLFAKSANNTIADPLHRVYRYQNFLTTEGIRKLRRHLDALSANGIPKRRPNAMNRNGLLLDASVPGGVSGDGELQDFVALLARVYLQPLGRALFPEFAGDALDDTKHYAFTIQYGSSEETNSTTKTTFSRNEQTTDRELKTHTDASVYTLNINLNLPEEEYAGSSLYFVPREKGRGSPKNAITDAPCEIVFEPGTALIHRGMTKHGARPLESGQRNNMVIWLHGIDGYVRVAPYSEGDRFSVQERWSRGAGALLGARTTSSSSSSFTDTITNDMTTEGRQTPIDAFDL